MTKVVVRENELPESALRRLRRAVEKSGVLAEVRRRQSHIPNSTAKRIARDLAAKRERRRIQAETEER